MTNVAQREWLSTHWYFDGEMYGRESDQVFCGTVRALTAAGTDAGLVEQFFCIRYGDDGSHIRARLLPRAGREGELRTFVESFIADRLGSATYTDGGNLRGAADTVCTRVSWIPYEPEIDRYGGPVAMPIVERFFWQSTMTTFDVVAKRHDWSRGERLGQALLYMIAGLYGFGFDRRSTHYLMRSYHDAYLPALVRQAPTRARLGAGAWTQALGSAFARQAETLSHHVVAVWDCWDADETVAEGLDHYRQEARNTTSALLDVYNAGALTFNQRPATSWGQGRMGILPSLLHMTSNRLGVTVPEESYLAKLIDEAPSRQPRGHPPRR